MAKMCMAFDEVDSVYLMAGTYDFALIVKGQSRISHVCIKNSPQSDGVLSASVCFINTCRYRQRMNLIDFEGIN